MHGLPSNALVLGEAAFSWAGVYCAVNRYVRAATTRYQTIFTIRDVVIGKIQPMPPERLVKNTHLKNAPLSENTDERIEAESFALLVGNADMHVHDRWHGAKADDHLADCHQGGDL